MCTATTRSPLLAAWLRAHCSSSLPTPSMCSPTSMHRPTPSPCSTAMVPALDRRREPARSSRRN
uniref:Uncharacterized protein n=1 Tax=Arundo donax TaxID=35708 RepID=A0A0A9HHF9_ARUDO